MDIQETQLPGIGLRYELSTGSRGRLSIIVRRDGRFEIGVYDDPRDPDRCRPAIDLEAAEASALASILGAPRIIDSLAELEALDGLRTEQIRLEAGSPFDGAALGDTQARTRTGASIVAIVRAGTAIPSPTPSVGLRGGDVLVVVGTPEGLTAVRALLRDG